MTSSKPRLRRERLYCAIWNKALAEAAHLFAWRNPPYTPKLYGLRLKSWKDRKSC